MKHLTYQVYRLSRFGNHCGFSLVPEPVRQKDIRSRDSPIRIYDVDGLMSLEEAELSMRYLSVAAGAFSHLGNYTVIRLYAGVRATIAKRNLLRLTLKNPDVYDCLKNHYDDVGLINTSGNAISESEIKNSIKHAMTVLIHTYNVMEYLESGASFCNSFTKNQFEALTRKYVHIPEDESIGIDLDDPDVASALSPSIAP